MRLVILLWCIFDILPNGFPLCFYAFCCFPAQALNFYGDLLEIYIGKTSTSPNPFLVLCCVLILLASSHIIKTDRGALCSHALCTHLSLDICIVHEFSFFFLATEMVRPYTTLSIMH